VRARSAYECRASRRPSLVGLGANGYQTGEQRMKRRQPTAVYRVIDEEELLADPPSACAPAETDGTQNMSQSRRTSDVTFACKKQASGSRLRRPSTTVAWRTAILRVARSPGGCAVAAAAAVLLVLGTQAGAFSQEREARPLRAPSMPDEGLAIARQTTEAPIGMRTSHTARLDRWPRHSAPRPTPTTDGLAPAQSPSHLPAVSRQSPAKEFGFER
jgi:hypothetical protein